MGRIRQPAIKNQFMPKVIIAHPQHKLILHPYQRALECEARGLKCMDKDCQRSSAWHAGVYTGTRLAIAGRHSETVAEARAGFLGGDGVVNDRSLNAVAAVGLIEQAVLVCFIHAIGRTSPDKPRSGLIVTPQPCLLASV